MLNPESAAGLPAVACDVQQARAERRADPFVQVEGGELRAQVRHPVIQLRQRMGAVDDGVDAAFARQRGQSRHRHDLAAAVHDVGRQQHPRARPERPFVQRDDGVVVRRVERHVDVDRHDAAARGQHPDRVERTVVVVARQHDLVAGRERIALQQQVQRLDGAARDQQFVRTGTGKGGQRAEHAAQAVRETRAQEEGRLGVDLVLVAPEGGAYRIGRHAEVAVLEVDEGGRRRVQGAHGAPVGVVSRRDERAGCVVWVDERRRQADVHGQDGNTPS